MNRFSEPQRLNGLTMLLGPVKTIQGWLFPIVVALFLGRGDGRAFGSVGIIAFIVVVSVARQALELLRLRWWVADGSFELRSGILQVETRSVPLGRIQNVDLLEPLLPRALGLAEVKIETAGGSGTDLVLRYIARTDAVELREVLATRTPEAQDEPASNLLFTAPTSELLVAGATGNQIGALIALAGVLWGWSIDLGFDIGDVIEDAGDVVLGIGPVLVIGAVLVVMILVGWVVSIAGTLLRYHGFVLSEYGVDLRREHGLLTRSSGVIPINRVQAVRIERPLMRRFVHRATIMADTAGSVTASADTGSGVVAPIIRDAALDPVVERVLGLEGPFEDQLRSVSPLAVRRMFIGASLDVVITFGLLAIWRPLFAAAIPIGLVLSYLWAKAAYRAIGYRIDDELIVARSGVLTRRTWLVPVGKAQSTVVRSNPFQRRLGLATLSIDTAGPGSKEVVIIDLERATAEAIAIELSHRSAAFGLVSDGV
ncbi:MAG: PH domain-containing protein [Acidimicrobiia bacterium]